MWTGTLVWTCPCPCPWLFYLVWYARMPVRNNSLQPTYILGHLSMLGKTRENINQFLKLRCQFLCSWSILKTLKNSTKSKIEWNLMFLCSRNNSSSYTCYLLLTVLYSAIYLSPNPMLYIHHILTLHSVPHTNPTYWLASHTDKLTTYTSKKWIS